MNMRINTPTSKLDPKVIRKIVKNTIKWCEENMGVNNRRSNPFKISVRKQWEGPPCCGMFNPSTNTLYVFPNNCNNIKLLIETTLHEYTHYLQPINKYYWKLLDEHGYDNHPMEIEARNSEGKYLIVWNKIKNNI